MKMPSLVLAGLAAGLLALSAHAQPAPAGAGAAMRVDCSKAKDPGRCEARKQARLACKDKRGIDHRNCMQDQQPAPNCAKAQHPQRCEQRQKAREACKGRYGADRRQCMRDQRPAGK